MIDWSLWLKKKIMDKFEENCTEINKFDYFFLNLLCENKYLKKNFSGLE